MKKLIFLGLVLSSAVTLAQNVRVSGTVVDQKGEPIPFAFVSDTQHPYATYTDLSGKFTLMADPASNLLASANFHTETKVKIDNPAAVKIVLGDGASQEATNSKGKSNSFFSPDENRIDHVTSINRVGAGEGGVHGSRYLFADWVHGFAISPKDSIKQSDVYLFNYDKVAGNLLFTRNKATAMLAVKDEVKSFILYDENAAPWKFEQMPAIDAKHYVQLLVSGPKYNIYKTLTTEYIKANFVTNGISSSGNTYDEYKDNSTYYVVKAGGAPQKLDLKSKSIKAAFAAEPDKLKKFMSENDTDIDEGYVKLLGEAMNK
ncbi:carboxypeptidase-like regulatory domain-containing protein [Mucilaginibacter glaciei]|uniref:Carboxypeptidase-like protein n=1 Tax=Mucilaginibacter glaciei TaxID=2772109 RepID=A0A926NLL9_9SPHI|nr:carboxypeptidase-like regulatory domain-containing protein [Mucilaginibacter glaciei]MBD1393471.1 hypothetical protein [Mucilaginibacter glaciei]